ncbi:MAG: hypothetical protein ACOYIA_06495 [Eubacteriales bacterium]|jgi:hypothetical protein
MNKSAKQSIYFAVAAFAALLLAVLGIWAAAGGISAAKSGLLYACSVLLLVLSALYVYIIFLSCDREPNYFLYDKITCRNIPLSELTWSMVDERVDRFITEQFGGGYFLWSGSSTLSDEQKFGPGGIMRPLVAYKMLCDIAVDEKEGGLGDYFKFFEHADLTVIKTLCRILDAAGEGEMARAIMTYKTKGGSPVNFRHYLGANAKYLQGRMLAYVRRNIERFY